MSPYMKYLPNTGPLAAAILLVSDRDLKVGTLSRVIKVYQECMPVHVEESSVSDVSQWNARIISFELFLFLPKSSIGATGITRASDMCFRYPWLLFIAPDVIKE